MIAISLYLLFVLQKSQFFTSFLTVTDTLLFVLSPGTRWSNASRQYRLQPFSYGNPAVSFHSVQTNVNLFLVLKTLLLKNIYRKNILQIENEMKKDCAM